MSGNTEKGTKAETAFRTFLRSLFPGVERAPKKGHRDEGDLIGIPMFAVEIKDRTRYEIGAWLEEAETERVRRGARFAVLLVKPRSVGLPRIRKGDGWAVMRTEQWAQLVAELVDAKRQLHGMRADYADGHPNPPPEGR